MAIVRTDEEIYDQIDKAMVGIEEGSKYSAMSYEEGVKYALEWAIGQSNDIPME